MQAFFNYFSNPISHLVGYGSNATQQSSNAALPNDLVKNADMFLKDNLVQFEMDSYPSDIKPNTIQREFAVHHNTKCDGLFLSQHDEGGESTGKINVLFTPMTASGSAERLSQPNKCAPGDNAMWLTEKQSGCVVAILKWPKSADGANEYSMVHLQPHDWKDNPSNAKHIEAMLNKNDVPGFCAFQDSHLKDELTALFGALSRDEIQPEGYSISFSSLDYQSENLVTQVIGSAKENDFVFYEQKRDSCADFPTSCKELSFTSWDNFSADPCLTTP